MTSKKHHEKATTWRKNMTCQTIDLSDFCDSFLIDKTISWGKRNLEYDLSYIYALEDYLESHESLTKPQRQALEKIVIEKKINVDGI